MKNTKYFIFLLPYICAFLFLLFKYKSINLISYLLIMIIPMLTSVILAGIGIKRVWFSQSNLFISVVCTGLYFIYFCLSVFFMAIEGVYEYLYCNSQDLITEGFSIGTNFSFSPFDTVLPCCLCFVLHLFGTKVLNKKGD